MKKFILFLMLYTVFVCFSFGVSYNVNDSIPFYLVFNKEGETDLYFSLTEAGAKGDNSINPIVEDNTHSVSTVFYVGYDIYSDVLDLDTDKIKVLLTFSASGDEKLASDYMLQDIGNPDNGLVFDYKVTGTTVLNNTASASSDYIAEVEFPEDSRDKKQLLQENGQALRQTVLYQPNDGAVAKSPLHGFHRIEMTINPPVRNVDGNKISGFITGQYRGYAVLSVESI